MQTEPIRLPAWLATLLVVVVVPFLGAWLAGVSVKAALATVLAAVAPMLVAAETSRRKTDAPATVEAKVYEARRSALDLMQPPGSGKKK